MTRLAFVSNSWLEGDNWGPFQRSLIDLLAAVFDEVLVVRSNSFVYPWSLTPLSDVHLWKLARTLESFDPDVVFSINRAGLNGLVLDLLPQDARIITLFIDYWGRIPGGLRKFDERDFVWGTGTGWLRDTFFDAHRLEIPPERVLFTLWASDTTVNYAREVERDIGVLFVGSPLQHELFYDLVDFVRRNQPDQLPTLLDVYFEHRKGYVHDVAAALERRGFDPTTVVDPTYRAYLKEDWIMQSAFSDQISAEVRLRYLSALADPEFDLQLYGEPERLWIDFISLVDAKLLRRYTFRPVKDPVELPTLYSRTKIGLNIQHHHASDAGLSMRVFDIMACGAVLLTHRIARKPLEELGYVEDEDYVAFESVEELRAKARALLADEEGRSAIAESGCRKTHAEHSLQKRLALVFERAGFAEVGERFAALARAETKAAGGRVSYVSDPARIDLSVEDLRKLVPPEIGRGWRRRPQYPPQPFPRTSREVRAALGRMLPDEIFDVKPRIFRNWFLHFALRRDAERGQRR